MNESQGAVLGGTGLGPTVLGSAELGTALGADATIVQFSSTFCQPCRMARLVLERAVATTDGVAYVDLDVADHLELGERLGIDATPTVLVLDASGTVRYRATGVPLLAQVRARLAGVTSSAHTSS